MARVTNELSRLIKTIQQHARTRQGIDADWLEYRGLGFLHPPSSHSHNCPSRIRVCFETNWPIG